MRLDLCFSLVFIFKMDTEGHLKVNILLQNEMPFLPRSAGTFYVWIDAKLKNQLVVVPPRLECPFPNNLLYFSFSSSLSLKQTKKCTQRIQFFIFPTTSLLLKNLWDIEVAGSAVYLPPIYSFRFLLWHLKRSIKKRTRHVRFVYHPSLQKAY